MRYAQMRQYDIANGPGVRCTLFVSGCTHHCPGCFNEAYQNFEFGQIWDSQAEETFMEYVHSPNVKGVTILGGEPMQQIQDTSLLELLKRIKRETQKSIWLFSGYSFEELIKNEKQCAILKRCDVLVDGPFIEALKDMKLHFRGSSNQRIINVKASMDQGKIVLEKNI